MLENKMLRKSTGGRYTLTVTNNGTEAITNPLLGIIAAGVTPEISFGIEAPADPGTPRIWIDDGAGALVNWRTGATFTVHVANWSAAFTLTVNIRLPHGEVAETVGTGAIP